MRSVPQTILISLLSFVAALGFHGSLDGWGFLVSAALGASVAAGSGLVARHYRLFVGESVALSAVVFTIGGAAATLGSYPAFFSGLIDGWANLLTSAPPAELTPELRVLPYATAWAATTIGIELNRRSTIAVLAIIGPATAVITTALVSVESPRIVLIQGVSLTVGALVLALLDQWSRTDLERGTPDRRLRIRRASAIAVTALVAAAAPVIGPWLPLAGAHERFDLRAHQDRPWDPLSEPSPLVTLKASLKEGRSQNEVFTVTAPTPLTRFTTAVLATYNGTVWAVADESPHAPAEFEPVDDHLPAPADEAIASVSQENQVAYRVEFAEPTLWIPAAGRATEARGETDLQFNEATGTLAAPVWAQPGTALDIVSTPRTELSAADLLGAELAEFDGDDLELVPPQLRDLAGDIFEGVDPGADRVIALADRFTQQGYYDHGSSIRPGHNLARLDEFLADPNRIVGYAEQYAAAAGVLSQLGGVPTRVAVGYEIPTDRYIGDTATVVADDIAAWIEVKTVEYGWVPITTTPDRAREPQNEQLGVTVTDVAIPNPPPPPPPPPDDEVVARADTDDGLEESTDDEDDDTGAGFASSIPTAALVGATAVALPIVLLGALGGLVIMAKRRRRRSRRNGSTVDRITGAWLELIDGFTEAGIETSPRSTPRETVAAFVHAEPLAAEVATDLERLARHVDRASFHPSAPDDAIADDAWSRCDNAIANLQSDRTRWQRLTMQTDPRPLIRRSVGGTPR